MYIITVRRIISGDELKYRNGFFIRRRYGPTDRASSPFALTAPIDDIHPGMFEVEKGGVSVAGEMYRLSDEIWARVEEGEPPNLYCGPVQLEDGQQINGILYPQVLAETQFTDISDYGDWRAYMRSISSLSS
jgi:hypothetical protein